MNSFPELAHPAGDISVPKLPIHFVSKLHITVIITQSNYGMCPMWLDSTPFKKTVSPLAPKSWFVGSGPDGVKSLVTLADPAVVFLFSAGAKGSIC